MRLPYGGGMVDGGGSVVKLGFSEVGLLRRTFDFHFVNTEIFKIRFAKSRNFT
jgi:hypothetical protein